MQKNIAFFTSDWNYQLVNRFLEGMEQFLELNPDVNISVFDEFGVYGSENPQDSKDEFFYLPDLTRFDGVILEGNQSWPGEMRQKFADYAKGLGLPVVSINYQLQGVTFVGTDNFEAEKEITEHVIRAHGARKLLFVRGLRRSEEAQSREQGFLAACRENGVGQEHYTILDGSWSKQSGWDAAETILQEHGYDAESLPDAAILSNDDMAVGFCDCMKKYGVRVPEDIIVTGFDNLTIGAFHEPRLCTIERDYPGITYTALTVLKERIEGNGGNGSDCIYSPHRLINSASCGCPNDAGDIVRLKKNYHEQELYMQNYYRQQSAMDRAMLNAEDLNDFMDTFEKFAPVLGARNVYLMVNAGYLRQYEREHPDGAYTGQAEMMAVSGEYANLFSLHDGTHVYSEFSAKNMIPEGVPSENRLMVFCPLHYNKVHLGYVVLDGRSPSIEFNFLQTTLMLMENAMENIRRTHLLKQLNHRLHTLYVKDPLTGLYNRIGLERFGAPMFERLRKEGKAVRFCFMDVDNMKEINAIYGYEMGDTALRMLADSVTAICGEEGCFGMRYGSDEFLILGETDVDHFGERLEDAANQAAKDSGYPFRLRVSLGQYVLNADEKLSLEACINKAGQKMIEDKKEHNA